MVNTTFALIFIVIIVSVLGYLSYEYIAFWLSQNPENEFKNAFQICDSFCHCGEGNYTVITYIAEQKLEGWAECTCLLSEIENPVIFQKGPIYVISENYTCRQTVSV